MRIPQLRVKIKSLAAEARIIRCEEQRAKSSGAYRRAAKRALRLGVETDPVAVAVGAGVQYKSSFRELTNREREIATREAVPPTEDEMSLFWDLRLHRVRHVREEARAAQLAYGFVRGRLYHQLEDRFSRTSPDWHTVALIVQRFALPKLTHRDIFAMIQNWRDSGWRLLVERNGDFQFSAPAPDEQAQRAAAQ